MTTKPSLPLAAAALLLFPAATLFAQTSGISHPDDAITTSDADHYVKPSAGTPLITAAPALHERAATPIVYGTYKPYNPSGSAIATVDIPHPDRSLLVTDDINSGIVTSVPVGPNELAIGTTLKATLQRDISTRQTAQGATFKAVLTSDIGHNGRVLLPAGSIVNGRITRIHGGRRISGGAAIHMQPDSVTLPDGSNYRLNAEVTDLDHFTDGHVNSEGTIVSNAHGKATAAILGATTGTAVIAGAMIGGGVGAVVGLGVGAGVGTIWWLKQDRQETIPENTEIVFSLNHSLQLTPTVR